MRIAIISSPRSGNSWLRGVLRDGAKLQDVAVHNYLDAVSVPDRCVLQIHWYREPNFQSFLKNHGFHIVSLARHPLDILISVLHFIKYEPETSKWLGGNCNIPEELIDSSPASNEFLQYALSFGAENLLSVTYQWWFDEETIKLRYEELVADPVAEVNKLAERLNVSAQLMPDALATNSFEVFKATSNRHGWQGRPGLWRELIPFQNAAAIFARHQRIFEGLRYTVEPTELTRERADERWTELT